MQGPILKSEPELLCVGFEVCEICSNSAFHLIQPFNITYSFDKLEAFPNEPTGLI